MSRDHAIAHEVTNLILHPSPAPACVARCAWKQVAQVVRNRAGVPNWHKRKFSQDMLNRDDIQYGFSVVKLVLNLGSYRLQPSCQNKIMNIIYMMDITRLHIIHISRKCTVEVLGPGPSVCLAEAENRSNTRAYQTVSGDTTKAPLCGRIMTGSSR